MSTVVLLRHAKSDWPDGVPDESRPLSPRGERDARAVGRWLARNVPDIDLALVSPAHRAQRTWLLAAEALDPEPQWRTEQRLYYKGADGVVAAGAEADAETLLVVGHNPSLEMVVERSTGQQVTLRTATVAVLTVAERFSRAELVKVETIRG